MPNLYRQNRKALMQRLSDGLIILGSAPELIRNGDVLHDYRQDSNFLYFTGISQPNHTLILNPKTKKSYLFIPVITDHHRIWDGRLLTTAQAKKQFGVDQVFYQSDFLKTWRQLSASHQKIYFGKKDRALIPANTKLKKMIRPFDQAVADLRIIKSSEEVSLLQVANDISHCGHVSAMKAAKHCQFEYQIQSVLESDFLSHGAFRRAYGSIVASGANAAILHYHNNDAKIQKQDLVLIDAGCEWHGYASDITRTFPASGTFSNKQKAIYQIVLDAQNTCIKAIQPGIAMPELHRLACEWITRGLQRLGIFYAHFSVDELIDARAHMVFFPHGIGHLLGLDVHDVGAIKSRKKKIAGLRSANVLKAGMVVTVEPGIYFIDVYFDDRKKSKAFDKYINWTIAKSYRSVGGIRIEDDILVTKNGHMNLTHVPKEIKEIESIMKA